MKYIWKDIKNTFAKLYIIHLERFLKYICRDIWTYLERYMKYIWRDIYMNVSEEIYEIFLEQYMKYFWKDIKNTFAKLYIIHLERYLKYISRDIWMYLESRVGNLLFGILCESLVFWEGKSNRANHSHHSFCKYQQSDLLSPLFLKERPEGKSSFTKSEKSDEKHGVKNEIEAFTLESHFHKEQTAPITLYIKTTFSPIALYKKSDWSE